MLNKIWQVIAFCYVVAFCNQFTEFKVERKASFSMTTRKTGKLHNGDLYGYINVICLRIMYDFEKILDPHFENFYLV